ncbi:putative fimbrial protein [Escherichia coli]|uniref:Putative fimbrial protein n=1 Tax=Escherichia coli TaxID=562 RepID=A0A376MRU2_ECOLX|nr:putative fimbrial protein [Escherichia coli]
MRVNLLIAMIIVALIWPATALRAAVSKTTWADAPAREFVLSKTTQTTTFSSLLAGRWIRA